MSSGSFAAAQERILVRHAARRTEVEAAFRAREALANDLPVARLPFPFNRSATPLLSLWNTLTASEGTRPAFRVGQVDAELLDEELLNLLRGQAGEALKYFGAHLQDDWSQEITLGLRAILFKLSVWDHDASYGASLQNLRFTDARREELSRPGAIQKLLYGLVTVVGRYGWDKWEDWLIEQEGGYNEPSKHVRTLSRITSRLSAIHSIAAFFSFIIFLINGRYRTLTDRILRLRLIPPISQIGREVSFEYLNRQLVWHAFTEFLLFLLPLVGISRWRRWLSRVWKKTKAAVQNRDEDNDDGTARKEGPLAFLPERTCAICYQDQNPESTSEAEILGANTGAAGGVIGSAATDIVNPYETVPCRCVYCFVCLATKIEAEEGSGWTCLRCGEVIFKCKPWTGDIIERKPKTNAKNVGFVVEPKDQRPEEGIDKEQEEQDEYRGIEDVDVPPELGASQWDLPLEENGFDSR